jgi:hypothetical protein
MDARALLALATLLAGGACMSSPPEGPLVVGPTLAVDVTVAAPAQLSGTVLAVSAPLDDATRAAHADFLAGNASTIELDIAIFGELRPPGHRRLH